MAAAFPPSVRLSLVDPLAPPVPIASLLVNCHVPVPAVPAIQPPLDLRLPALLSAQGQESRRHEPPVSFPSPHSWHEPPNHIRGSSLTKRNEVPLPAPFVAASFCRGGKSRYPELIPLRH